MKKFGTYLSHEEGLLDDPKTSDDSGIIGTDGTAGPTPVTVDGTSDDIWSDVASPEKSTNDVSLTLVNTANNIELPKPETILGDDSVPGKLPVISANIVAIDNNVAKVADLKEIEDVINTSGVVSRDDAQMVHDNTQSLFTQTLGIEEFSETPSRTNFTEVKNNLSTAISNSVATTNNIILTTIEDLFQFSTKVRDIYSNQYKETIIKLLADIKALNGVTKESFLTSKNMLFPSDGDFFNILSSDITKLPSVLAKAQLGTILTEQIRTELYVASFGIAHILNSDNYFKSIIFNPENTTGINTPESVISIKSILENIGSDKYDEFINKLEAGLIEKATSIENIKTAIESKELNSINWDKTSELSTSLEYINRTINIICRMPMFIAYVEKFCTTACVLV